METTVSNHCETEKGEEEGNVVVLNAEPNLLSVRLIQAKARPYNDPTYFENSSVFRQSCEGQPKSVKNAAQPVFQLLP